jgi:hypothetical protein
MPSITLAYGDYIVSDCETAWNEQVVSNVTQTLETTLRKVGAGSAKFNIADGFTTGIIGSKQIPVTDLSAATSVALWIRSTVEVPNGDIQLIFSDQANCANIVKAIDLDEIPDTDTWFKLTNTSLDMSACTAIVSIGLKLPVDLGAQIIYLDDVTVNRIERDYDALSLRGLNELDDVTGFPSTQTRQLLDGSYYESAVTVANRNISFSMNGFSMPEEADRNFLIGWFFARNHRYISESSNEVEVVLTSKQFVMEWVNAIKSARRFTATGIEKTPRPISSLT